MRTGRAWENDISLKKCMANKSRHCQMVAVVPLPLQGDGNDDDRRSVTERMLRTGKCMSDDMNG